MTPDRTIIAGILLTLPNIWLLTRALRKGQFYQRGPHARVDRRRQPVHFWLGIAATGLGAFFGLAMLAWGVLQRLA
jgi:hypothetical protein